MKFFKISAAVVLATLTIQASAQKVAAGDRISALAASWVSQASRPDGLVIEASVSMNRDGSFSGAVKANGKRLMTYEGTWKLVGNQLNWVYVKSQPELPEGLRVDSDELISVNDQQLVLRSDRSGETRTYQRQQ